ncbi:glycoside hydrolase family 35 protein [Streptomyces sp. CRN 30]|uniref:glycoside hydrolase family 35 protein n=1 Tax=Streptomyces sp. CRN 30 TaxID=3075613 RepID=UPI002A83A00A|nr:glycoside hydrolase family 35 protein [Streptomyces sp. CRN 30]
MLQLSPEGFTLDGRPLRLLSGALHYFRVLPEQWPHRLRMLRALGLNTVETYVPWNLHEPRPGTFDFTGLADLDGFLRAAREAGLYAIVRPAPYICAEWENGGLPWWLSADPEVRATRCRDAAYLAHVDRWYDRVVPLVAGHQITRGGNVLLVQVENEYGSYGTDTGYLDHLARGLRARGIDVPLFTSDGAEDFFLTGGTLPGTLATVNFGSRAAGSLARLRRTRPDDPLMCAEFWCGWFDHWGERHVVRDPADAAKTLAEILETGASVNLYMAHGGTNFATWAGANAADPATGEGYLPTVTSYDYDAPIDERGAATAKFHALREVLAAYADGPLPEPPPPAPLLPPASIPLTESLRLFDVLGHLAGDEVRAPEPPSFEELGIAHGLVLYGTRIPGPRGPYALTAHRLADRAHVFLDGAPLGVLERGASASLPDVAVPGPHARLELLVESMGRINYGSGDPDRKGVGRVLHTQQRLHDWTARPVPLGHGTPDGLPWGTPGTATTGPVLHRGFLDVREPADTFVGLTGLSKGYLWVNGFCVGRYWPDRGPQRTLYVPWPLLRPGANEIVVLELDHADAPHAVLRDTPDLGRLPL